LKTFTDKWAGDFSYARGNGNNRVTQPLNGRTIYYSSALTLMTQLALAFLVIGMLVLA